MTGGHLFMLCSVLSSTWSAHYSRRLVANFHRAVPRGEPIVVAGSQEIDRVYRVVLDALLDTSRTNGEMLGRIRASS